MNNLLTTLEEGILTITINRPSKLNALNRSVIGELGEIFSQARANNEVKGILITGTGEKSFAAGADISEFAEYPSEEAKMMAEKGHEVLHRIDRFPKPVIAAVNGFCLGGGAELAMASHLRICSSTAKFGLPEVTLGLLPGYGGTQRLTQLIGKAKALELILTGEIIDANTALSLGLVNHVTPQDELLSFSKTLLHKITSKAPFAISQIIKSVHAHFDKDKNGFEQEINSFAECFNTEDFKEGVQAFLEKRKPNFTGH